MSNMIANTNGFRLVISVNIDDEDLMLEFDNVSDTTINASSSITTHPIANGDIVADHMYRNPVSMSVTGVFSLQGNRPTNYRGPSDRLSNIETVFETIKNRGLFCTLVKMTQSNNVTTRFLLRENMVLTSITWTERQNSLGFAFEFVEVMTVDVKNPEKDPDVTDPNLPDISDLITLNFTDELLDWSKIDEIVIKELYNNGLLSSEFLEFALTTAKAAGAGGIIGAVGGIAVGITVLNGIALAVGSIPVAGWIAAGVIVASGFLVGAIAGICQGIKKANAEHKYKVKAFQLYKNDRQNQQEVERFANYVGTVHQNLMYLNDHLQVYGISSNKNQEALCYIDDKYYIFTLTHSANRNVVLDVKDMNNKIVASADTLNFSALSNLSECKKTNYLFRTKGGGLYVYAINKMAELYKGTHMDPNEILALNKHFEQYVFLVTDLDLENFIQALTDIIVNAMTV